MADERILSPLRRFWSKQDIETAYKRVFDASLARVDEVVVIIGNSEGEHSANGQVVVTGEDYVKWMDAFEARLQEIAADEGAEGPRTPGTPHLDFSFRQVRT